VLKLADTRASTGESGLLWVLHARRMLAVGLLVVATGALHAFPSIASSQPRVLQSFHHSSWKAEEGLGAVFNIQQAPDGFLWLTTGRGVFRFDGVRFESVHDATDGAVLDSDLDSVFISRSGGIWFATRTAGMLLWQGGKIRVFSDRVCTPSLKTDGIAEDEDGSLWFQNRTGLAHLSGNKCEQVGTSRGYPGGFVAALFIDHQGTLWIKTKSGMLLFRPKGERLLQRASQNEAPTLDYVFMHEAPNGAIWLADDTGLHHIRNAVELPAAEGSDKLSVHKNEFGNFAFDKDGVLWAGTTKGIARFQNVRDWPLRHPLNENGAELFTQDQGLSSNAIWKIFIDREGSIWVGSNGGLDQLRSTPFHTVPLPGTQQTQIGLATGQGGSLWIGSRTLPLTEVTAEGRSFVYPSVRLITCIRSDPHGTIWVGGDTHLWKIIGKHPLLVHYPREAEHGVAAVGTDKNGDLWLLLFGGDVYHRESGDWKLQNAVLARKPGVLGAMTTDAAGNVWLAYSNSLVRWNGSSYDRYSFPNGSLNISVTTLAVRNDHVWLGGTGGIVLFQNGHFQLMRWKDRDLPGRATGVIEGEAGDLWANGYSGATHVASSELTNWLHDFNHRVEGEHLGALDGLPGLVGDRNPEPSIVEANDGRLWFATTNGVAWLDPLLVARTRNPLPPPVQISSVTTNDTTYRNFVGLTLPPHTESIRMDFTALSLFMPQKVLFRYKLEGVDAVWQESGTRRQAFYTKLPPGAYQFHVIACNNDGVWNTTGATVTFRIAPAYYQTMWFKLGCGLLALLAGWLLFRLRLEQVTQTVRERLAGQVAERERIARELHDTFLQGLYAVLLRFQTIADHVPADAPVHKMMTDALDRADAVLTQGRESLRDLRGDPSSMTSVAEELECLAQECRLHSDAQFTLVAAGEARAFHPVIRDEIIQIGREAITNSFRHSFADLIRVELCYERKFFSLTVSDNGRGIDPLILAAGGKPAHWGMLGMRERCRKIGAQFSISSPKAGGTEVELRIPSKLAYASTMHFGLWK
jgi:signal transduction histidine kinase/ligand-binding sensor domain-containing protein